jgi:hypothetical protein
MEEKGKADHEGPLPLQEEAALPPLALMALNTSTISLSTDQEQLITPKRKPKKCCKCYKIFSCILLLIIIILIAVVLFFALYIFKKRPAQITASSASLESLSYSIIPVMLNLVMGVNISIKNPNYAGFKYQSTNITFFYHGIDTGMSPMPAAVVNSRSSKTLYNTVYINATTMINSQFLLPDLISGRIPLSTRTYMVGKVILFNIVKFHATMLSTCDVTVNLLSRTTTTTCNNGGVKILY